MKEQKRQHVETTLEYVTLDSNIYIYIYIRIVVQATTVICKVTGNIVCNSGGNWLATRANNRAGPLPSFLSQCGLIHTAQKNTLYNVNTWLHISVRKKKKNVSAHTLPYSECVVPVFLKHISKNFSQFSPTQSWESFFSLNFSKTF